MVYAKTKLFENELQVCATYCKALAHPARLAILKYLLDIKVCMTGDISEELPLSRTTVNQHLKELKAAGLIVGTTEGSRTNYCLNPTHLNELKLVFQTFIDQIDTSKDYCKK